MSSRKKKTSNGSSAVAPAPRNGTSNGSKAARAKSSTYCATRAEETTNTWGWGRPVQPPADRDVFAYRSCPWWLIGGLDVVVSVAITYLAVGVSWWALLLLPVLGALLALPCLAAVLIPLSWQLDPAGPGNPEKYFIFKDKAFERKWQGQRIPIEELYEAYFDEKLDVREGDEGLLDTLYQRHEYARCILTSSHVKFFLMQFIPELIAHTRFQDITQVREHYDRGDDFYNGFLGPSMTYTSGIWHNEDDTLEQAQINKMDLIAQKMHLREGDKHLDLGCGWGTFINYCAKNYGTQSYGVTLGRNQTAYQNQTSKEEGVSERARAICMDYRDVPTHEVTKGIVFDKISCLEMSEHVGVKNYSAFVRQVREMLADDGIFYLQIAGLRRAWQFEDFNWGLFMGKYVFPGADASCPLGWVIDQLEAGGFEIRSEETIGIHYSATIRCWYENWMRPQVKAEITAKYGVRMYRLWAWFLAWSVISPEQGSASCYQIVAHKNTRRFNRKQWIAERKHWQI
jgi:cyclopropane fatty-acyl-phospholipid synthase-like methyltransferase